MYNSLLAGQGVQLSIGKRMPHVVPAPRAGTRPWKRGMLELQRWLNQQRHLRLHPKARGDATCPGDPVRTGKNPVPSRTCDFLLHTPVAAFIGQPQQTLLINDCTPSQSPAQAWGAVSPHRPGKSAHQTNETLFPSSFPSIIMGSL